MASDRDEAAQRSDRENSSGNREFRRLMKENPQGVMVNEAGQETCSKDKPFKWAEQKGEVRFRVHSFRKH